MSGLRLMLQGGRGSVYLVTLQMSIAHAAGTCVSMLQGHVLCSTSMCTFADDLLGSQEMFRPTGQDDSQASSCDPHMISADLTPPRNLSEDGSTTKSRGRSNTYTEEEEEERTAGSRDEEMEKSAVSMLDYLVSNISAKSDEVGGGNQAEESHEPSNPCGSSKHSSGEVVEDVCVETEQEGRGGLGVADTSGDAAVAGGGTPEGRDKEKVKVDRKRTPGVGDKGTAEVDGMAKPEVEDEGVDGSFHGDLKELAIVNPVYAQYVLEKRKQSAELKRRSNVCIFFIV